MIEAMVGWAKGATRLAAITAAASLGATMAQAEVTQVSAQGFTVVIAHTVESDPDRVWQAFTQLPQWWNNQHTWSGQAANMSLEAQAGGCWCERWGNGQSVMHGQVVMVQPGSALRLNAWLGPLQELAVAGVITFGTVRRDGATRLRVTYRVAGAPEAGFEKLAPVVDRVLSEQVARLKKFIETGKAE
ncbi:MAG: SRPBCC family protein [Rubrivivax sp.]|nr:SRPBCC family protein [Rubrivivax sp.]